MKTTKRTRERKSNPAPRTPPAMRGGSRNGGAQDNDATVVFGPLEDSNFLKVPKVLFKLARYNEQFGGRSGPVQPRHMLLILTIASHVYRKAPTRLYWQELANDLGVSRETVRKWAYQAEEMGLLKIKRCRDRREDSAVGYRNERNIFDISPMIPILEAAQQERTRRQEAKKKKQAISEGGEDE